MRLTVVLLGIMITASAAQAEPLPLGRGVGLHGWLNWSPVEKDGSYRWPPYRTVDEWLSLGRPMSDWPKGNEFARIRSLGFDFVRLTVDPGPLAASEGARRKEALDLLSGAVQRLTSAGLKVVFNLHGVSQVPAYGMDMIYGGADSDGVTRYRTMVKSVASMLMAIGTDKVAFEPYNEPAYYPCDASGTDDWQRIMTDTVADIRSVSTELTIVATGACGGSITGLANIEPTFDDENIYYSFHMYEPHSFTHQRSDRPGGFVSGFPWPARSGSPESVVQGLKAHMQAAGLNQIEQTANLARVEGRIAEYFQENWDDAKLKARIGEAVDWATRHGISPTRLFMGEFGVIRISADGRSGAYDADRLHYLRTVRETAEDHGFPWSIWEYANPDGMTVIEPQGPAVPDADLLQAIGLPKQPAQ
ncbi:glycoside hydrolase family 5 protein [Neorhizobium sp. DT-125]|uniref:glycoside hydrolase family 5 protein n=1 Tax=Neorhizobium sp. DT-125 TaxID=3396163 RepID=UPI003F1AE6D0